MLWPSFAGGIWGDPWRELRRLQREMNGLFSGAGWSARAEFPAVNVHTKADGALVTAELPGMSTEDMEISVEGNTLTLRGTRKGEQVGEETVVHRQERGTGSFVRTVQLPFRADPDKVEATYERGVLRVSLETAAEEKPRKIAVKTA